MGAMYIPETEENDRIQRGIVIGKVELLPPDVKLPLPLVRSVSQKALRKYFGGVELNTAVYSPGGEPVSLPVPKETFTSLCGFCSDNPRLGHSTYCADCIKKKTKAKFVEFYGRDLLMWHYALIALVGILLIFGIVKYAPRPGTFKPVSTPIYSIQKVSAKA